MRLSAWKNARKRLPASTICERIDDPEEAQFWSVYGHLPVGGVECLEDFPTE
jgi:hypothetical protein